MASGILTRTVEQDVEVYEPLKAAKEHEIYAACQVPSH